MLSTNTKAPATFEGCWGLLYNFSIARVSRKAVFIVPLPCVHGPRVVLRPKTFWVTWVLDSAGIVYLAWSHT